jgi:hypothetical protein
LDGLTGDDRNKVYRMLRLEVTPTPEGYEVTGAFCGLLYSKTDGLPSVRNDKTCSRIEFRAFLTESSVELELTR